MICGDCIWLYDFYIYIYIFMGFIDGLNRILWILWGYHNEIHVAIAKHS
jgi:hypothetical protein